jgi:hypothetical protein
MVLMSRSTKLGIASLFLLVGCVLPSPINFACAVIACVLGSLAAQQGSKWWLAVPCAIIASSIPIIYFGFQAN